MPMITNQVTGQGMAAVRLVGSRGCGLNVQGLALSASLTTPGVWSPIEYRLAGLAVRLWPAAYIVSDHNASTGAGCRLRTGAHGDNRPSLGAVVVGEAHQVHGLLRVVGHDAGQQLASRPVQQRQRHWQTADRQIGRTPPPAIWFPCLPNMNVISGRLRVGATTDASVANRRMSRWVGPNRVRRRVGRCARPPTSPPVWASCTPSCCCCRSGSFGACPGLAPQRPP
jgi:hypothetical protein